MSGFIDALRDEIRKQARKEVRAAMQDVKKKVSQHRREIVMLKNQLAIADKRIAYLERSERKRLQQAKASSGRVRRYSARSLHSHRTKVGCSAAEYGKLLGVSGRKIYQWEQGKNRPPVELIEALAELRSLGKRAIRERLRLLQTSDGS